MQILWCWIMMGQFWKWCLIWFWTAKIYGNEEKKSIAIYVMMWGQGGLRTTILVTETVNRPFALLLNRIFSLFPNTSSLLLVSFLFPLNTNYQPNFVEQVSGIALLSFLLDLGPLELQTQPSNSNKHWRIYDWLSDVPESRVWFASKNLTPCRMH